MADQRVRPNQPWHRGYVDPKSIMNGVKGSIVVLILSWAAIRAGTALQFISVEIISFVSHSMIDVAYYDASSRPDLEIPNRILAMVISFIIWLPFLVLSFLYGGRTGTKQSNKAYISMISKNPEERQKILSKQLRRLIILRNLGIGLIYLALAGPILFNLSICTLTVKAASTEARRMMILAPYLSDQEYKQILGQWGGVASKSDFDMLMKHMERTASDHHVSLPKRQDE